MMDLEIADYERTIKTLNEQIELKNEKAKEQETEIDRLNEMQTALQKQLGQFKVQILTLYVSGQSHRFSITSIIGIYENFR